MERTTKPIASRQSAGKLRTTKRYTLEVYVRQLCIISQHSSAQFFCMIRAYTAFLYQSSHAAKTSTKRPLRHHRNGSCMLHPPTPGERITEYPGFRFAQAIRNPKSGRGGSHYAKIGFVLLQNSLCPYGIRRSMSLPEHVLLCKQVYPVRIHSISSKVSLLCIDQKSMVYPQSWASQQKQAATLIPAFCTSLLSVSCNFCRSCVFHIDMS